LTLIHILIKEQKVQKWRSATNNWIEK